MMYKDDNGMFPLLRLTASFHLVKPDVQHVDLPTYLLTSQVPDASALYLFTQRTGSTTAKWR